MKTRLLLLAAVAAPVVLLTVGGQTHGRTHTLGPTAGQTRIDFALSLKLDRRLLDRDLAAGRAAPSAGALGARYGLPAADIGKVERLLGAHGIAVTATYPQRTEIDARASAATLSRFFGVGFRDVVGASGGSYHEPTGAPRIPSGLRPFVTGVVGLSNRPVALPADLPHDALRPDDAAIAYDLAPLRKAGIDGTGEAIAVVSLEPFPPNVSETSSDVSTFRAQFGAKGPSPEDVKVDGGGTVSDLSEDDLDLDVVSAIAPGAQIINYEAPETAAGEVDVFNRIVADGKVGIVTFSWGLCDFSLPSGFRHAVQRSLQLAVARGITVFVSSGDSGSYDCQRQSFSNHSLSVDFPSDLPQVVSVGGTLLSVGTDGSYFAESGWENPLSDAGGGGGIDTRDAAPSWQRAAHLPGGGHRVLPDVAASASPASGWIVRDYGNWDSFGGTSASSPFWASSMLLAEQYARKHGVNRRCFLAPILYRLATTPQPYPAFHDVRTGGNRFYSAKKGWDFATGFGSPDVYNLTRDLTAYLRSHPCGPGS
ncbi:MAG TPA: S53 family peptidase [Gaiellaceae bacterium]|nr:S53 family peptidase [Gaiellaceae bacterium]